MLLLGASSELQVAPEAGALEVMSEEVRHALKHGDVAKAKRFFVDKTNLRALIQKDCKCSKRKKCLKCSLFIDDNDLVTLLNFFAGKLIDLRLTMHKLITPDLSSESVVLGESLTSIYRFLIKLVFPNIKTHVDLDAFREDVRGACIDHTAQKSSWLTELLLADSRFFGCAKRLRSVAERQLHSSTRNVVVGILQTGAQISKVTDESVADTGDCSIAPQQVLYQLLVAHDCQRRDLFRSPNDRLGLQH